MRVNDLTGEVTLDIGGTVFQLKATVGRMAALETKLGVKNIPEIIERLNDGNVTTARESFKAICTSPNADAFDEISVGRAMPLAIDAIIEAIAAFLPRAEEGGGKNAVTA